MLELENQNGFNWVKMGKDNPNGGDAGARVRVRDSTGNKNPKVSWPSSTRPSRLERYTEGSLP
jgi:hypothetical protein